MKRRPLGHRGQSVAMVRLRALAEDDWRDWRALRRAALEEAPDAFTSTLEEWSGSGDSPERWRQRLVAVPFNVLAYVGQQPMGMVSAVTLDETQAELLSLWVDPGARGQGVGDELVIAVVSWAAQQGCRRVVLGVRASNERAITLYGRNGFVDVGRYATSTPGAPAEREMARDLALL